jgi:hypothetical protein
MKPFALLPVFAALLIVSAASWSAGYYVCQDLKTGRKVGQDFPCEGGKELGSYAPVSPDEQKARDEMSRKSKRAFERQHPGTYSPEEYMTDEEYAEYRVKHAREIEERRKRNQEQAAQEALRRAEAAEQRAREAERIAREAEVRAAAAEEAASVRPLVIPHPVSRPRPSRIKDCDLQGCRDVRGNQYKREVGGTYVGPSNRLCVQNGNMMQCP